MKTVNKIETNKMVVPKLKSMILKSIEARGSGTSSYVGTVKLETETEFIFISWNKINGKPHLSIYTKGKDEDYLGYTALMDYRNIVDSDGKISLEWPEIDEEFVNPTAEIITSLKEVKPSKSKPAIKAKQPTRRNKNVKSNQSK